MKSEGAGSPPLALHARPVAPCGRGTRRKQGCSPAPLARRDRFATSKPEKTVVASMRQGEPVKEDRMEEGREEDQGKTDRWLGVQGPVLWV